MEFILGLATTAIEQVGLALLHNWPYLVASVVIATLLKQYIQADKISAFLSRHRGAGVLAATAAAVGTPLCSCGTTAVVLGMMASTMPWAPIVAFMVASPLTSQEGLVYSAGLFGWPFAIAFYLASILLGLGGGWAAAVLERRGWLANQTRFGGRGPVASTACSCSASSPIPIADGRIYGLEVTRLQLSPAASACGCSPATPIPAAAPCGCGGTEAPHVSKEPAGSCECGVDSLPKEPEAGCACSSATPVAANPVQISYQPVSQKSKDHFIVFLKELLSGGKQLLVMFVGFAFIGYFLNGLIPASWVTSLFGGGHIYNIPLAATLGLPFYINSEASLPLIRALLDAGMSQGAALAFLIAGSGTSIGAITGALTIARWRVVALVVGVLWIGAILSGFAFDLLSRVY